jgi:hypothetical protein
MKRKVPVFSCSADKEHALGAIGASADQEPEEAEE